MNCKKIRGLLIADYPDKELKPEQTKQVEEHLKGCPACKAFEQTVAQKAVLPFKDAQELPAPAFVWTKIREAIDKQEQLQGQFDVWGWLKKKFDYLFVFPRPVYALVTIMTVFLTVILVANRPSVKQTAQIEKFFTEEADFVSSLDVETDYNGFGATVDELIL